jgi:hypothetical protein
MSEVINRDHRTFLANGVVTVAAASESRRRPTLRIPLKILVFMEVCRFVYLICSPEKSGAAVGITIRGSGRVDFWPADRRLRF